MKFLAGYLSCLLALLLVLFCATSCGLWNRATDFFGAAENADAEASEKTPKSYAAFGKKYTLCDADKEAFSKALGETLRLMQEAAEESVIDASVDKIEDRFFHISDQADLAYVLFCMDQEDQTASDNYLYASKMKSDAYYDYMMMCQAVDASSFAYRERFFEGWSENDFLQMRQYTEEVSTINKKNDEILVEYRALDPNGDGFAAKVSRLYGEMVKNNQALAEKFGYSDYAAYAYEAVYERDYSREELAALRGYVQTYLVPLCKQVADAFLESYKSLNTFDRLRFSAWLYNGYDSLDGDPVGSYFASLPSSIRDSMGMVLQGEHSLFTDDENAYEGAFTGFFYEDSHPFCYFGPGYHSVFTVIHEAGHFCAAEQQGGLDIDLDLAELHSQGNEWLMLEHSKGMLSNEFYSVLRAYKIYESICTVIIAVMIDEFEETVYTGAASIDGSTEQMDGFMREICARYGGEDFVEEYIADASSYWKLVVIESPVYYISYAVSAISSLTLYSVAREDYQQALQIYESLIAKDLIEDAFLENLKKAGLASPFEEGVYVLISKLIQ